jgi:diguanylate cyclase (GGDEF)-like protein
LDQARISPSSGGSLLAQRSRFRPTSIALLAVASFAIALVVTPYDISGAFWAYPAVLASYAVLPPGAAAAGSLGLLAAVGLLAARSAGVAAALGFIVSLGLVIAVAATLLHAFDDLHHRCAGLAITDALTGAFNRRHFDASIRTAIERRNRTSETATLLLLDVDHFKAINDAFGHAAGDDVLKALVEILGRRLRSLDGLFRIGGEEFAVLLVGARCREALVVAEDIRCLVAGANLLAGRDVSISIGVSELQKGQSANTWMAEADAALYRAKRGGRNRVVGRIRTA